MEMELQLIKKGNYDVILSNLNFYDFKKCKDQFENDYFSQQQPLNPKKPLKFSQIYPEGQLEKVKSQNTEEQNNKKEHQRSKSGSTKKVKSQNTEEQNNKKEHQRSKSGLTNFIHSIMSSQEDAQEYFATKKLSKGLTKKQIKAQEHWALVRKYYQMNAFTSKISIKLHKKGWQVADLIIDSIFFIDILLKFNTEIKFKEKYIYHHKQIARNYLKIRTSFVYDLLSTLPFYLITEECYYIKLLRLVKLTSLITELNDIFDFISRKFVGLCFKSEFLFTYSKFITNSFKIIILCFCVTHLLGCIFLWIGKLEDKSDAWIGSFEEDKIESDLYLQLKYKQFIKFNRTLYFTFVTVTTIGYGDILPNTISEQMFTMFLFVFGICFFSFIIENTRSTLLDFYKYEEKIQETVIFRLIPFKFPQIEERESWFYQREIANPLKNFPQELYEKMNAQLKFLGHFNHKELFQDSQFLNIFQPVYQNAVILYSITLQQLINQNLSYFFKAFKIFFGSITQEMKNIIGQNIVPRIISPNELILLENYVSKGIYFIIRGKIYLAKQFTEQYDIKFRKLQKGSFFGEECLHNESTNFSFIGSENQAVCLFLPKLVFQDIMTKSQKPKLQCMLRTQCRQKLFQQVYEECSELQLYLESLDPNQFQERQIKRRQTKKRTTQAPYIINGKQQKNNNKNIPENQALLDKTINDLKEKPQVYGSLVHVITQDNVKQFQTQEKTENEINKTINIAELNEEQYMNNSDDEFLVFKKKIKNKTAKCHEIIEENTSKAQLLMARLKKINIKFRTASKEISRISRTIANKKYLFK